MVIAGSHSHGVQATVVCVGYMKGKAAERGFFIALGQPAKLVDNQAANSIKFVVTKICGKKFIKLITMESLGNILISFLYVL